MGLLRFIQSAPGVVSGGRKDENQTKLGAIKQSTSHNILWEWLGEKQ